MTHRMVWGVFAILFVLHQDCWWWDRRTLMFGFLPIGLFYHAVFSLAAAGLWAFAIRFAWPDHIEEWADEGPGGSVESDLRRERMPGSHEPVGRDSVEPATRVGELARRSSRDSRPAKATGFTGRESDRGTKEAS